MEKVSAVSLIRVSTLKIHMSQADVIKLTRLNHLHLDVQLIPGYQVSSVHHSSA